MALVPVRVSATFVDEWGTEDSAPYFATANDTQTIAALGAEVQAWVTAMDNASDAMITAVRLTLFPTLPGGIKTAAGNGSRVEQQGLLGFSVTGTSKRYSSRIPAIGNGGTVLAGNRIVLTAIDPVGLLIKLLTTVGTVLTWCNEHDQAIKVFIDALVAFHKKRKQLQRSSFEV